MRDQITLRIFDLCDKYNFQIMISYVKSADNISDRISRKFTTKSIHAEWTLSDHDFKLIKKLWQVPPDTDLFASIQNKKFRKFFSWKPCVDATAVDAFSVNWKDIKGYIFAPFSILCSVIKKCLDDEIQHMCGIFPMWKTKTWYPNLIRLAGRNVTILPRETAQRLYLPWDTNRKHPMGTRLTLLFANLSVKYFKETIFQNPKPIISRKTHGVSQLLKRKNQWSNTGNNTPKKQKLIGMT